MRRIIVAMILLMATVAQASDEIIIDDADKSAVTIEGDCIPYLKIPAELSPVSGTLLSLGQWSKPNPGNRRVTFNPNLPKAGDYAVYVRWCSLAMFHGLAPKVPVTVAFAGGAREFSTSQQAGNLWVFFGVFPFTAGTNGSVSISDKETVGTINIDAVKLVPVTLNRTQRPKVLPVAAGKVDAFDAVRTRLADLLTTPTTADDSAPEVDSKILAADFKAHTFWLTMNRAPDAKALWPDLWPPGDRGGGGVWEAYQRLNAMARAYVYSSAKYGFGQQMQGNPQLLAEIVSGLEWLNKNAFNKTTKNPGGGAWFPNEIGIPTDMSEIVNLLYPAISPEQRQRYMAAVENMTSTPRKSYVKGSVSTGANRVWLCYVHVLRGLIEHDEARIKLAVDALDEPLTTIKRSEVVDENGVAIKGKTTDGFYGEGSFVQHGHLPYTTGYGNGMLISFAKLIALLNGSPWGDANPKRANIAQWVYNGIEPMVYRGDAFPRLMGRGAAMKEGQNQGGGYALVKVLAELIPAMPPADAQNFRAMLKAWLLDDYYKTGKPNLLELAVMDEVRADKSLAPRPRPIQSRVFYNMDFVVHHRPGFAAALSMSSTRIATHECIWTANRKGWYQGDGMLMVYLPEQSQYNENFWPTINPYRLPGITVDTQTRKDGADGGGNSGALSKSPWAGGVELGKHAATASMALAAQEGTLTAKKSWFFFDDAIICLGAGINSTDNRTIETIVENAALNAHGDNAFTNAASWAHLSSPDIGWYFPQPGNLQTLREARTGTWEAIYKKNDIIPVTRHYQTLWFDHGKNPKDATYQYVILPGKTAEQVQAFAAKPTMEILANTPTVQAVRAGNLLGINFWSDTPQEIAGVKCSGKAAVLIEETADKLIVAVADPTQLNAGTIDVRIARPGRPEIKVSVPVKDSDGRTFEQEFPK